MSLNILFLCSKLKNGLLKIVKKLQVVTKFNVTKSRLHCTLPISDLKDNLNIALFVVFEPKLIFYDLNVQT